jgi:hypothetical protein
VATRLVVTSGKMVLLDKLLRRLFDTKHRWGWLSVCDAVGLTWVMLGWVAGGNAVEGLCLALAC